MAQAEQFHKGGDGGHTGAHRGTPTPNNPQQPGQPPQPNSGNAPRQQTSTSDLSTLLQHPALQERLKLVKDQQDVLHALNIDWQKIFNLTKDQLAALIVALIQALASSTQPPAPNGGGNVPLG